MSREVKSPHELIFAGNVKIIFLPYVAATELLDYVLNPHLSRFIRRYNPHIIHIQESSPQLLRFLFKRKSNIVVTQHGIMREEIKYNPGWKNKIKYSFKILVERYVLTLFSNLIFISEYNQRFFRGRLNHSAKIFNPVNPIFFSGDAPEGFGLRILYTGVINRRKNLMLLLRAIEKLKAEGILYRLEVVGGYKDPSYQQEIDDFFVQAGIGEQVKFHGWLSQERLLSVYRGIDVLVLASMQETLPVSVAEAMAMAKPVIATHVGAVGEMFVNGESGYIIERDDLEGLCQALKAMALNPAKAAVMGNNARAEAKQKFEPESVALQTLSFYNSIINVRVR
jgi:glycosyltransferase involved in cell wall biosynthesis